MTHPPRRMLSALRRVATLVARAAAPQKIFAAVAEQVATVLPEADFTIVGRYDGAAAVAGVQARAELAASRALIVAAADETRRRMERDLHDAAQQRLVTLALQLRAAQERVPPETLGVHLAGRLPERVEV